MITLDFSRYPKTVAIPLEAEIEMWWAMAEAEIKAEIESEGEAPHPLADECVEAVYRTMRARQSHFGRDVLGQIKTPELMDAWQDELTRLTYVHNWSLFRRALYERIRRDMQARAGWSALVVEGAAQVDLVATLDVVAEGLAWMQRPRVLYEYPAAPREVVQLELWGVGQ